MGGKLVQLLLRYGFVIALVVIVLGFGLQFYRTHRETQPAIDARAIIGQLEARHRQELARMENHYQEDVGDWKRQAEEAVTALASLRGQADAPPGTEQALAMLEKGRTEEAAAIFQAVAERKEKDIEKAAAAYRHLGALAFLDDTQKSLSAYRRATELEPNNAEGWKQLGNLLFRIGKLDEAEAAYRKVESLGEAADDRELLAAAYNGLGLVYQTRGDLNDAEAMHKKALVLEESLGRKAGMAADYGNLGIIYKTRGDLTHAEAMHKKALALSEAIGSKKGTAVGYGNLGATYGARGDLDDAEAMYRRSFALFQEIGATHDAEEIQGWLARIPRAD
jgi:tetratricopeptide (TPR) repeat protein